MVAHVEVTNHNDKYQINKLKKNNYLMRYTNNKNILPSYQIFFFNTG